MEDESRLRGGEKNTSRRELEKELKPWRGEGPAENPEYGFYRAVRRG
jgi:hypothetical protein